MRYVNHFVYFLVVILCSEVKAEELKSQPILNFSDLISGPATGLNDGRGTGTIVTIWGQNLGDTKKKSNLFLASQDGSLKNIEIIYYWKKADGELPSGPANLYKSHRMQEIAFSIPKVPNGDYSIYLEKEGILSNSLPFSVRDGNIYHVKYWGDNKTGDGTFERPWQTISKLSKGAIGRIEPGDIIYVHDSSGEFGESNGKNKNTALYISGHVASLAEQSAIVAYPNSAVRYLGLNIGASSYKSSGLVFSKLNINAGNFVLPSSKSKKILPRNITGYGIRTSANGRLIGLNITQTQEMCVSGQSGAITGSARQFDYVSNVKIFGNYIHNWGCKQSSHFGHVIYLSNRSNGKRDVEAWDISWNHLNNNLSKFGIHSYDESFSGKCGNVTGTIRVANNYVDTQKGPGISFGAYKRNGVCWNIKAEITNNVLINTGLGPTDENGISSVAIRFTDKGLKGKFKLFHNTVYQWGKGEVEGRQSAIEVSGNQDNIQLNLINNLFFNESKKAFENNDWQLNNNTKGDQNLWYTERGDKSSQSPPAWDSNPLLTFPGLVYENEQLAFEGSTPNLESSKNVGIPIDFYGNTRSSKPTVGAIEQINTHN